MIDDKGIPKEKGIIADVYFLGVHPEHRDKKLGSLLMKSLQSEV